ncbi:hypothetical protein DFP72DRAFT_1168794 [Ephemerocybe angulata]|uniref:Uncharacterized protein n=1 Tax=Ephemerocybe angulata TaxID=980116 RepID=A0A8H6M6I6_9AGAR|nr:hypothetical protein DFP72DRAFT_1168794 [Tulosesus angulatus]
MKAGYRPQTLDRTLEAMHAYRLARQILVNRNPSRWGNKCTSGHEDMRTTFVWMYLKLKYNEDDGRKTVTGRIFRLTKTPSTMLHPSSILATGVDTCTLLDPQLVNILGLSKIPDCTESKYLDQPHPDCRVMLALLYSSTSKTFSLQYSSPPASFSSEPTSSQYIALEAPMLALFRIRFKGSPFSGGCFEMSTPWTYARECTLRLLNKDLKLIREARVILTSYGPRYDKITVCRFPQDFFDTATASSLQGCIIEQDLTLNMNSIFMLCAIHSLLPDICPFSRMIAIYVLGDDLDAYVKEARALTVGEDSNLCQDKDATFLLDEEVFSDGASSGATSSRKAGTGEYASSPRTGAGD